MKGGRGLTAHELGTPARVLLYSVRRAPWWTVVSVVSRVAGIAVALAFPAALARAVDAALGGAPGLVWLGSLIGAALLTGALEVWAAAAGGIAVEVSLRRGVIRRVLEAGIPGRRRFSSGDVGSRLVSASEAANLVSIVLSALGAVALSAGGLVALALIDWWLAVAFVVCVPVATVLVRRFVAETTGLMRSYRRLQGDLSARLVEALTGARTIQAGGTLDREVERVLAPLPELGAAGRATWEAQRRTVWKVGLLAPLTEVVVLAVAGVGVSDGRITAGSWVAVAGYVTIALGLLNVVDPLMGLAHVRVGTARLAEVLSLPAGPGGPRALPDGPGAITFRSVTVHARDGAVLGGSVAIDARDEGSVSVCAGGGAVLDGVDLDIPPGLAVAVVGRSGAGKSTLAALAGGLLRPDRGEVLLDGADVAEVCPEELRRAVAYAFERPALLGDTVHDMIAYGSVDVSREEVELAALRVSADGFIRRLPDGYDTALDRVPLSGGEAQRLGLARAVVRERRVLILDDATSSLDTATEAEVTMTLTRLLAGRTRIVVAHRAATAARTDLVVWLEDGRVRATGPHDLLWREPDYRALFGEAVPREPA
ncbi:ATP-binding cassette, subfamily B [Nonomuraea solani]|uniref:ATP-binding cassette, subfamily B n=1 Tax=Nonomuraea solani TaxID=1144553 RepID=A0A1H5WEB5_9ACTN|nr:ABC transporter ATP-binding protein [Nonomuraea solani]SEF97596.1 ATP-binding cassette, subfamily B [Nonomuraea solani]